MSAPTLYRAATWAAGPALRLWLDRRARLGKEERPRLAERFGIAGRTRPAGRLVWIHAASIGESLSILPLVDRLRALPSTPAVLVTTGTRTSAELMARRLPEGALHQFVPLDRRAWVERFLDHWRPDLVLWVESELWPNLLAEASARAPVALINGRISAKAAAGWQRWNGLARAMAGGFRLCLAQTQADAERLRGLGAARVEVSGNLKWSAAPLPADLNELVRLKALVADRPCWIAASTHPGEEAPVAEIHRHLKQRLPALLTIIVPRHPERGAEIAATLTGQPISRRSLGQDPSPSVEIYLADTLGELGLFYRLADMAFVGGSLVPHGGQNPVEPVKLGVPVLWGPHMANFAWATGAIETADAGEGVADATGLEAALSGLLTNARAHEARVAACRGLADEGGAALERTWTALLPLIEEAGLARA